MARPRPSSVPSTSPSGWTWPSMSAAPRGRRSASSSWAGGCSETTVMPAGVGSLTSLAFRGVGRLRAQVGQKGLDVRGVLHGSVGAEEQLRSRAQIEVAAKPAPHEAARALEGLERGGPLFLRPEDREVHLRVLEVRTRVHLGDGDEAEAWVLELTLDEHRDLFLDQLVHALEPLGLHLEYLDLHDGDPAVDVVLDVVHGLGDHLVGVARVAG